MGYGVVVSPTEGSYASRLNLCRYSLLETLHTGFSMRLLYFTTVLSFGRLDMVGLVDWFVTY